MSGSLLHITYSSKPDFLSVARKTASLVYIVNVVTTLLLAASDNLYGYASRFAIFGFSLTTAVSDFVFIANLTHLEAKEKRSKDDEEDS